ncbi:hypothetical protein CEXT_458261 [Caerostris extrusa]|uniref:Uncharacterized protein n=1 Tax=Caerostris extrusa TaxID=172846 RepID=A0AAV4Y9D8_CAEEX|nr:hypothetical protein CEXT_458261 [Caerostris extrusa]
MLDQLQRQFYTTFLQTLQAAIHNYSYTRTLPSATRFPNNGEEDKLWNRNRDIRMDEGVGEGSVGVSIVT